MRVSCDRPVGSAAPASSAGNPNASARASTSASAGVRAGKWQPSELTLRISIPPGLTWLLMGGVRSRGARWLFSRDTWGHRNKPGDMSFEKSRLVFWGRVWSKKPRVFDGGGGRVWNKKPPLFDGGDSKEEEEEEEEVNSM